MVIEESDFRLTSISNSSTLFDLELLYTIKPKGKESRQEFKIDSYGISLELAIKKITQYRVATRHKEEAIRLSTYFTEFKEELDSIKELCNN